MNNEIYSGSIQDSKKVEICEVAVKKFLPKKFYFALYELINNSRIYQSHPNLAALRGVHLE